jgi:DMSO/TMAO reductase YedYZ molybdopterin-dependent catalytic subunit
VTVQPAAPGRRPPDGPPDQASGEAADRLDVRPTDRARVPPGQYETEKWPVLHYGAIPRVPAEAWTLEVRGAVERPLRLTWDELMALPQREVVCDIHCVTQWSRLDNRFVGVPVSEVARRAGPEPGAAHVLIHAPDGWSSNLPREDLLREEVLLAHSHDGRPLEPEHGGPLRLVVPHLYFWKSAKWVTALEFVTEASPGFWERNGYHMRGDPWREERFAW